MKIPITRILAGIVLVTLLQMGVVWLSWYDKDSNPHNESYWSIFLDSYKIVIAFPIGLWLFAIIIGLAEYTFSGHNGILKSVTSLPKKRQ